MFRLMSFPRYAHRQSPQTVTVMQQLVWIVAPQGLGAVVLAPQPTAQPVSHPSLRFAEHARALPVVEISTPAPQQLVQFVHCLGYAPMQCPVVKLVSHLVSQPLAAFGAGFDVCVPVSAHSRALPAHTEAQEVKPFSALHPSGLFFVELEAPRFQPAPQSAHQLGSLPRSAQDDEGIGVAHQRGPAWLLGVVDGPVQRIEVEVGQQRRDNPALRHALLVGQDSPFAAAFFLHYRCIQPLSQQVQYAPVAEAAGHQLHQASVGDGVEVFRQIRVHDFQLALAQGLDDGVERLVRTASGSEPTRVRMKVRLEDGCQHQQRDHLHHPVSDRGDSQRSLPAVGFGNINPPHRARPVCLGLQFPLQLLQPLLASFRPRRDGLEGLPINPRRAAIALDQLKRILQQIESCQFTIQAPEPVARFGLGLAIERALELSELFRGCYLFRAITRSFTPLLRVRTSSVPSVRLEVGASLRVQCPEIEPTEVVLIMNASDSQTDRNRLAGRTGLRGALSFDWFRAHRLGSPRLFGACLPDVLTTLTPTEFTGVGDWVSCEQRPSHNTPEARRLRAFNITRLIRCGSSSFRPVGSLPRLLYPSCLAAPWTGSRSFRREPPNSTGGTFTHESRTLRGLLRSDLFIVIAAPTFYFSAAQDLTRNT